MIKNLFKNYIAKTEDNKESENNQIIKNEILNVVALLIQASGIDGNIKEVETNKIKEMIGNYFNLEKESVENYYKQAFILQKDSVSFHDFTSKIHNDYSYEQKIDILEMFWKLVLADNVEHDFESNLMRRICGLLHMKDIDSGKAKKRIKLKL